jgi:hypothetical protein
MRNALSQSQLLQLQIQMHPRSVIAERNDRYGLSFQLPARKFAAFHYGTVTSTATSL